MVMDKGRKTIGTSHARELLAISTALLDNTTDVGLLKTIYDIIKPIFPFDNAGLFVLEPEQDVFYDILEEGVLSGNEVQKRLAENNLLGPFVYSGNHPDSLIYAENTRIYSVAIQSKIYRNPQWKLMKAHGLKEMIVGPLIANNEKIGFFCFNSKKEGSYTENDFALFEAIGNQLALAVANMKSDKELREQGKRIEELLKISTAASNIQNRSSLLKVIFDIIKPTFPFDGAGLFVIDQENDQHYEILDAIDILGKHDNLQKTLINDGLLGKFKHQGSAVHFLSQGSEPHLFNIKKDGVKYPHPQFGLMYDSGLRQLIGISLRNGNQTFGMLCFNSKKEGFYTEKDFDFFKAISEQVSLALKNVLDNEELLIRQKRIGDLLKISTAASSIQDRKELLKVIFETIKPIFPFDTAGLFLIDNENDLHHEILDDIDILGEHDATQMAIINSELLGKFKHQGSAIAFLSEDDDPRLFNLKKDGANYPHPQLNLMYDTGLRQTIGVGLRSGNKTFGMLCFNATQDDFYSENDFDFFKAISQQVALAVKNVLANEQIVRLNQELKQERDYLIEEVKIEHNFEEIIGNSPLLKEVFKSVEMVANTDATVLIEGETGTGKELIARALHNRSDRKKKPIVKVNCATLPKELIASELFGHEKGSFTGAFERRIGKFELANNSSLFLDEIGEMPLELQAKLLRAIQEKEIERLGGKEVIKVNVRIIAATNRNLKSESDSGNFREDLFYRLNVFPILMPALRQRKEDIPLLATFFAQKYCKKLNTGFKGIKEQAMQELLAYSWPGNIRELENLIEQACILNQDKALSWSRKLVGPKRKGKALEAKNEEAVIDIKTIKQIQRDQEIETLLKALKKTNWRIRGNKGAAKLLDMKPTTLEYRMKKLGLK